MSDTERTEPRKMDPLGARKVILKFDKFGNGFIPMKKNKEKKLKCTVTFEQHGRKYTARARYFQDGNLFTCGCVRLEDAHLVPHPKPVDHAKVKREEDARSVAAIAAAAAAAVTANNLPPVVNGGEEKVTLLVDDDGKAIPPEPVKKKSTGSKLNKELAAEIRERAKEGAFPEALATAYDVSVQTINNILSNITYAV